MASQLTSACIKWLRIESEHYLVDGRMQPQSFLPKLVRVNLVCMRSSKEHNLGASNMNGKTFAVWRDTKEMDKWMEEFVGIPALHVHALLLSLQDRGTINRAHESCYRAEGSLRNEL